jgi:uncharacterized protein YbjT (DUF2867 family)
MEAISPVVQVVTGGTDWPAIVAAISTGVVGLAGIGGTLWSGKSSINAQDRRAELAQKRHIYGAYHAAINSYYILLTSSEDLNIEPGSSRLASAKTAIFNAGGEVSLIASANIDLLMGRIAELMFGYAEALRKDRNAPLPDELNFMRGDLYRAMRVDLGEPTKV